MVFRTMFQKVLECKCLDLFGYLPLTALTERKVLCLHGRLSLSLNTLDNFRSFDWLQKLNAVTTMDSVWYQECIIFSWKVLTGGKCVCSFQLLKALMKVFREPIYRALPVWKLCNDSRDKRGAEFLPVWSSSSTSQNTLIVKPIRRHLVSI
ncbi:hypothetical protein Bca101_058770 [Brassica carinata]